MNDVSASEPPGDSKFTPDGVSTMIVSIFSSDGDKSKSVVPEKVFNSKRYSPSGNLPVVIILLRTLLYFVASIVSKDLNLIWTLLGGFASSKIIVVFSENFLLSKTISSFIWKALDSSSIKVVLLLIPNWGDKNDALK